MIKRDRKVAFRLPDPVRSGAVLLVVTGLAVAYGDTKVLSTSTSPSNAATVSSSSDETAPESRRCCAVCPACRSPRRASVEIGYQVVVGYFAQEHEQIDPDRTVLENIDDTVLVKEPDRRKLLGSFGLTGSTATRARGRCPEGNEPGSAWRCLLPGGPTSSFSTSRQTTWTPPRWKRWGRCSPVGPAPSWP